MKKLTQILTLLVLAIIALPGSAQITATVCAGGSVTLTTLNNQNLSGPSYSMNPGGITSSTPTFVVAPASTTTYTLYVTGTNSNSAVVTTTNTALVQLASPTYSLVSPNNFSVSCGSTCMIHIINAQTTPTPGGPVSYTMIPPGNPTILPSGNLSTLSTYSITLPGTWSVVVRDNTNMCDAWTPVIITGNNSLPPPVSVSVSQNPLTCNTPTTLLQGSTSATNVSYVWTFPGMPGTAIGSSLTVGSITVAPTSSLVANYTLTVTDNNSTCSSTTVIPVYQNIFPPTASITTGGGPTACTNTWVLSHASFGTIPPGTFPNSAPVVAWLWEGPGPQITATLSTTYIAQISGVYTLTAMDTNNGCTNTATASITFTPSPVAAFTHTLTGGQAAFSDASTGTNSNTIYFWNFGDGNTSTLQNPTHTYLNGGAHTVKFKVTNSPALCADSVIQSVNVSGIQCSANSNFSMVPTATAQVWTIVPAYPWNVSAAHWNWGDGSSSNILYTSHQYSAAGTYSICLSVTVSCGDTSTTCSAYYIYRGSAAPTVVQVNVVAPEIISGLASAESDESLLLDIIPNPNAGEFMLKVSNARYEHLRILISDPIGRIVRSEPVSPDSNSSIQVGDLPSGLYLVTLEFGSRKITKRMIINR